MRRLLLLVALPFLVDAAVAYALALEPRQDHDATGVWRQSSPSPHPRLDHAAAAGVSNLKQSART